jgi:hypothetical protein
MCLWFAFLLTARVLSWLRLSQREGTWKTAEILILCHQLAVLQRQQPVGCQNSCRPSDLGLYPRHSCSFTSSICS